MKELFYTDRGTNKMLDRSLANEILASVDEGFEKQLSLTKTLMRFRSERRWEKECQDFVYDELAKRDFEMDRFAMDHKAISAHIGAGKITDQHSDVPIVVGTHLPKDNKGRSLILQSHIDVVPSGPEEMWTRPPFKPVIDGDWLYGRGGADMKAGLGANFFCLDALSRLGFKPASKVHLQSVVEEESTGNGALMTHLAGYRAEAVLIPEPEDEMLVRANTGVIWFEIEVKGVPVHVREMGTGSNAIDAAYRIMGNLRDLEKNWNQRKVNHRYFEDLVHPINLNFGLIKGGEWASSVPSWAKIDCRVGIYPDVPAQKAAEEILEQVSTFSATDPFLCDMPPKITFNGFFSEGYTLDPGSEAEEVLAKAHKRATDTPLQSFVTPGYLDTRVYALYQGVPALCYGPISENIHGIDERVKLSSLKRVTGTMALFVAEWCGLEKIS